MTAVKAEAKERRHPRSPWIGLYFAVLSLLAAILGIVALVDLFPRVIAYDIVGQRSEWFIVLTPFVLAFFGVLVAVRAFRAFRPWNAYRAATTREGRRAEKALDLVGQVRWPFAVFGTIVLLGWIALLFLQPKSSGGTFLLWEFQLMALLLWTAMLGLFVQTLYYARFRSAG